MGCICQCVRPILEMTIFMLDANLYLNSGQWILMFASIDTDIGSNLPFWAVQDRFVARHIIVRKFMGGWTTAYAKQYHLGECDRSIQCCWS